MKKDNNDDIRPTYKRADLGKGVRGKFYDSYQQERNIILLSPDVADVFKTENEVNNALRSLIDVAKKSTGITDNSIEKKKKTG